MIWDLLRYGWQHAYFLTIEGIPVAFGEMAGLPLPTGFTSLAVGATGKGTLIVDGSAEIGQQIDRATGIGAGYPLTFKLANNPDLSTLFRKRAYEAVLTATVSATDAIFNVSSQQDWSSQSVFWIGRERVTFTGVFNVGGKTTQFTGCTRGTAGGFGQIHLAGQPGAICCDVPVYWRGREVRLYAQPVSPAGVVSTQSAETVELWRGYIDTGPDHHAGFWGFEALSLDRKLTANLGAAITGTISSISDKFTVQNNWSATIEITGYFGNVPSWRSKLTITPFLGISGLKTAEEIFDIFKGEFDAVVAADPGIIGPGAANFINTIAAIFNDKMYKKPNYAYLIMKPDVASDELVIVVNGTGFPHGGILHKFPNGVPQFAGLAIEWAWAADGCMFGQVGYTQVLTVALDKALDFPIPPSGYIYLGDADKGGNVNMIGKYLSTQVTGVAVEFWNFIAANQSVWLTSEMLAQKATVIAASYEGSPAMAMRQALESSYTAASRGPDDLGHGGYAIDVTALDLPSFDDFDGEVGGLHLTAASADADFAKLFGGLLALQQRGLCAGQVGSAVKLTIVNTSPAGSDPVATLLDTHLLTSQGWPCVPQRRRDIPNAIAVTLSQAGNTVATIWAFDPSIALGQGGKTLDFDIPADLSQNDKLVKLVGNSGNSLLRQSQALQVVEIACIPWFYDVRIGDLIAFISADPTLWQYATGTQGYSGNARILGLKRKLLTGALTLVALLDGEIDTGNLSPAVLVSVYDNAANPTFIEVLDPDGFWLGYFSKCLASLNPFRLLHYQPGAGAEVTTKGYTFSAVAANAGSCRLTVAAKIGLPVLATVKRSTLTLPLTANCSAFQARFSHESDGTKWA